MPQLPSGRHIAFGYDPLQKLIGDASRGDHIDDLLEISDIEKLGNYIDVIYFHKTTSSPPPPREINSTPKAWYHTIVDSRSVILSLKLKIGTLLIPKRISNS